MFRDDKEVNEIIQSIARKMFILELIAVIIIAFVFSYKKDNPFVLLGGIIGGGFTVYLSNLGLYALGEIIYELKESNKIAMKIKEDIEKNQNRQ